MRERSESVYATLIIVSIAMIILGMFGLMIGLGAGTMGMMKGDGASSSSALVTGFGAFGLLGGIALLTFLMISGATIGATEKRGIRKVDRNTRVLARYGVDSEGQTLTLEWDFPDPKTRFYVRMEMSNGSRVEFQCVREVFDQCGEGMRGESHFQGRWLGLFRPYIGMQPIVQ